MPDSLCFYLFLFILLSDLSSETVVMFVLCTRGKRKPQWGDSGGNKLHKQQQEGAGHRRGEVRGGEAIKIFNKHCSITWQQMSAERNDSEEVLPVT